MKYNPSIAFDEMSGPAKGVTAAKTRGRKYIRNRGYGGSTRTSYQSSVKAVFKQLSQAWQGLTNARILAWNAAANTAQGKSVLGTKAKITGSNLFMRLNYWVVYCGGNIMETPPTLSGVEAPAAATIVLSSSEMTFTLAEIHSDVTNLKLIIQASEPQSNGITRAYSKAAAFADPYTPVATAIDIKSAYDNKCGAPNAGNPKVFFKYFYINTATGENPETSSPRPSWPKLPIPLRINPQLTLRWLGILAKDLQSAGSYLVPYCWHHHPRRGLLKHLLYLPKIVREMCENVTKNDYI